jgi:hypothetical protein
MLSGGNYVRFGAALCVVLALTRPAAADDARDADQWIRKGIELRKAHDDEGAVREFQKAYDAIHTPRAAGQLGLAEQALGRWEDAEHHVREAIRASDDPWVVKNHATLSDALGFIQTHLGRVEVMGEPAGAEVLVNGRAVGKLPLTEPVTVSAGQVDIELRAQGYPPVQRTVAIVAGQYQRVVLRLAKEPVAPVAAPEPAPRAAEPAEPAAPVAPVEKPAEQPSEGPSATRVGVKWAVAALAVASLAVGVTFTIIQRQNVAAFESYPTCQNRNGTAYVSGTNTLMPLCQESLNDLLLDEKVAIGGFVGAGAFAITWLILELTEPSTPPASQAEQALSSPICAPSLTGLGLACAFRF